MESKEKLKKMYDYIILDNEYGLMDKEEVEALNQDYNIIKQDLDRLEDIEEELGIDLITLFKALQNGVWVDVNPIDIDFENPKIMYLEEFLTLEKRLDGTLCLDAKDYVDELELKDYKKTWWLKEDKSE